MANFLNSALAILGTVALPIFVLLLASLVVGRLALRRLNGSARKKVARLIEDAADVSLEAETRTPVPAGR
jgi:hypothetical protein